MLEVKIFRGILESNSKNNRTRLNIHKMCALNHFLTINKNKLIKIAKRERERVRARKRKREEVELSAPDANFIFTSFSNKHYNSGGCVVLD